MDSKSTTTKPKGTLWMSTILCGGCGALLAVVISLLGVLAPTRELAIEWLSRVDVSEGEAWQVGKQVEWGIAVGVSFCVAFFVLDSAALWRRLLVSLFALTICCGSVFTVALFGGVFIPFTVLISISVACLFAILYASQHIMPCDGVAPVAAVAEQADDGKQEQEKKEQEARVEDEGDVVVVKEGEDQGGLVVAKEVEDRKGLVVAKEVDDEVDMVVAKEVEGKEDSAVAKTTGSEEKSMKPTKSRDIGTAEAPSVPLPTVTKRVKLKAVPLPNIGKAQKKEDKVVIKVAK